MWHLGEMDLAGAPHKRSSAPSGWRASPTRILTSGVSLVGGVAIIVGTDSSLSSDAYETALMIGGGSLAAVGVLLLLWQARQRPIALAGINAAPSLLFWWTAVVLNGKLDYTSPEWLKTMLNIFEIFGLLWALVGSVFVFIYAVQ